MPGCRVAAFVKFARPGVNTVPPESIDIGVQPTVGMTPQGNGRESDASGSGSGAFTLVGETLVVALLLSDQEPAL